MTKQVGNAAKMREALEKAQRVLHCAIVAGILKGEDAHIALNVVTAAISAPPRNCDVGTVEEQLDRYGLFCQNKCPECENRHSCHICGERYRMKCMVAWSQMPYDEGGSNGK